MDIMVCELTGKQSLYLMEGIGKTVVTLLIKTDSLTCSQSILTNAALSPKGY